MSEGGTNLKSVRGKMINRAKTESWFIQGDPESSFSDDGVVAFDEASPLSLFKMIDFDPETWFTLIWTGTHWVDFPGTELNDAIQNDDPSIRMVGEDFAEMFLPEAVAERFSSSFLAGVSEAAKTGDAIVLARYIAHQVHAVQLDKGNNAYIGHPSRVAALSQEVPGFALLSEEDQSSVIQAAWLHDVLEDSGENGFPLVLSSDLYEWGISRSAVFSAENLSRENSLMRHLGEKRDKDEYYAFINQDRLARIVKIADLADNNNLQRVELLKTLGLAINPAKYPHAIQSLNFSDEESLWFNEAIKRKVFNE